jgi:hypothetical protein
MIWNPFKKTEEDTTPPPFEGVEFIDLDGTRYAYKPTKTISPYDAAMLVPLFSAPFHRSDRFAYIRANKLEKHFKLIKDRLEEE